jgi:hypothetical protein
MSDLDISGDLYSAACANYQTALNSALIIARYQALQVAFHDAKGYSRNAQRQVLKFLRGEDPTIQRVKVPVIKPLQGTFLHKPLFTITAEGCYQAPWHEPFIGWSEPRMSLTPCPWDSIEHFESSVYRNLPNAGCFEQAWVDFRLPQDREPPQDVSTASDAFRALREAKISLSSVARDEYTTLHRDEIFELFSNQSPWVQFTCWLQLTDIFLQRRNAFPDREFRLASTHGIPQITERAGSEPGLDPRMICHAFVPGIDLSRVEESCRCSLTPQRDVHTTWYKNREVWLWA